MVIGVNGVGKTTTIGKLAGKLRAQNKKVILAAADTFRAAAGEQLKAVSYTHLSEYLEIDRQLLGKYPQELSGGEKQKIAIARALCNDPPFLFADEPTGNLDDASSKVVEDIFDMLHREMKKTIILVTHDLDFANKSEKKYSILNGRLVAE